MSPEDRLFADIALKLGLLDRQKLDACAQLPDTGTSLPDLLVARGWLDEASVNKVRAHQRRILETRFGKENAPPPGGPPPVNLAGPPPDPAVPKKRHSVRPAARAVVAESGPEPARKAAAPYLHKVLTYAAQRGASDLHVHGGAPLMARINGRLQVLKAEEPISAADTERLIAQLLTNEQWSALARDGQIDFAYSFPEGGRFRVNAYRQFRGMDIVFRLIPAQVPTLEQLGLPANLSRLMDFRTGIVLCTGPAGCGKSTTLASMLTTLTQTRQEHIITLENPVEFLLDPGTSWVNQRQVPNHTQSFARALRAALREDPDVIAITELRDRETIGLALSAAETGHLVLGTLHTGSAGQTIDRVINAFPGPEQDHVRSMLSESLRAVVSQRLVPRANGNGRAVALEVLLCTTAVANMIRDNKTFQLPSIMQTGVSLGMVTLDNSLADLVQKGTVTKEEARRFATAKERFK
jgi:twitching motility protein PilT